VNLRPRSLQARWLVLVLSAVTAVWLLTALLTWKDASHELDELLDSHLAQAAALLVARQAGDMESEESHLDAPSLHRYAPKVAFQVFRDGQLVLHSANAPSAPMVALGQGGQTGFATVLLEGTAWRVFAARGAERDIQVLVGEQILSREAILWAVLRSTLWPMAMALPLLALALWWAVRQGIAPLRQLGQAIAARQPDALHPVTLEGAPAELVPLVDALNALFGRIVHLLESERRFTADAAHELRTPIAAIRTQAQVALGEADDALRQQALRNTLAGCDRAARLVDQLLTLSRLEAAAAPAIGRVNLSALVQQVVADLAPQAVGKRQQIELDAEPGCTWPGNETLLRVLVRNLVDNAIRYSPDTARIRVRVQQADGASVLVVEDSGPGLSESDRQRLGERFFRVLGHGESGSGLGWSIVQRVAAVHGLSIQLAPSTELGGLAVRVAGTGRHVG
jgi:two-component system sensor histidine kinase QseC